MRITGGYYGLNKIIRAYLNGKVIWQAFVKFSSQGANESYLDMSALAHLITRFSTPGNIEGVSYENAVIHVFKMFSQKSESRNITYGEGDPIFFTLVSLSGEGADCNNASAEANLIILVNAIGGNKIKNYTKSNTHFFVLTQSEGGFYTTNHNGALGRKFDLVSGNGLNTIDNYTKASANVFYFVNADGDGEILSSFDGACDPHKFTDGKGENLVITSHGEGTTMFFTLKQTEGYSTNNSYGSGKDLLHSLDKVFTKTKSESFDKTITTIFVLVNNDATAISNNNCLLETNFLQVLRTEIGVNSITYSKGATAFRKVMSCAGSTSSKTHDKVIDHLLLRNTLKGNVLTIRSAYQTTLTDNVLEIS
jgi:hypothetical protein